MPQSLDEVMQLARAVVASGLAPRGFDTTEACTVAILHGLEVGLSPLAALQRIAIIEGRPTIWGDGALALVRASGLADLIEEWTEGAGPADWCAICRVRRRGDLQAIERRFSVADARRADLWERTGPWLRYPLRMLQMRARAFALRDAFPDVLGGLYLREEMEGALPEPTGAPGCAPAAVPQRPPLPAPAASEMAGPDAALEVSGAPAASPAQTDGTGWANAPRSRAPMRKAPNPAEMTALAGSSDPAALPATGVAAAASPSPSSSLTSGEPNRPTIAGPPQPEDHGAGSPEPMPKPATMSPSPVFALQRRIGRDARQALWLRREGGWTIPRPRTLAHHRTRIQPAGSGKGQVHPGPEPQRFTTPAEPLAGPPRRARSGRVRHRSGSRPREATASPGAHEGEAATLALYDDALACAQDHETLQDINAEFETRLAGLGTHQRLLAQRILDRHEARVRALVIPASSSTHGGRDE